jgi:hypothetical protein
VTEVPEDRVRDLERGGDEMEEQLSKLESDIETAQERADEQRERVEPSGLSPEDAGTEEIAGDWQGESSGAQQGDDPKDAVGEDAEGPPVQEAERLDPEPGD